ncbi:tetratricopeptide repeat protein [Schlesneria paludicola]|uniref:tetratricopeptide repeat protein n=1 Tax=Schlesneria paludicola TaxID=360056 RepID=UPI00029AB125|nr:tetratricopeptide repeat protein [Schlesneria paludicola]
MTDLPIDLTTSLQSSPILQGERVAFTGTLASMTHRQAMELVEQHGGIAMQHVGQITTVLVVGEEGWPLEPDGLPSSKLEHARQLHDKGEPIQIFSESEWLKLLGVEPPERRSHQLYTPAMLCQLLNIPVHEIRRWERAGLIKSVKKVFRLPYFQFEEVATARRLCELAASGVRVDQIAASLERLHSLLPNVVRPVEQLEILARGSNRLVFRDESGLLEPTGQRLFDFDPPAAAAEDESPDTIPMRPSLSDETIDRARWTSEDWFHEGCRLTDANELSSAIEALRLAIINEPLNPMYHFHLADALYRQHKRDGAIERYHVAVELDHNFLEAWTQLGCVLAETGDPASAKDAFQIALDLHPEYPDAHFHLAGVLEQLDRSDEAAEHWRAYLEFDQRGPWAEIARERLLGEPQI